MKILQFEDGRGASRVLREELRAHNVSLTTVQDLPGCMAALEGDRSLTVLVDLDVLTDGLDLVRQIHSIYPDSVIVVLATLENLSLVDDALKQGAWDYIVKQADLSHVDEISQTVTSNLEWKKLKTENRSYHEEKQWLAMALLESPDPIFVADQEGKIVFTNPELGNQLDYQGEELIGQPIDKVLCSVQTHESSWTEVSQPFPHKRWLGNLTLKRKDGSESTVKAKMTQILDEEGESIALIGICLNHFAVNPAPALSPAAPPPPDHIVEQQVLTGLADNLKAPLAAMLGYLEMALTIGADQAEPHQILSIKRVETLARRLYESIANHSEALEIEAGKFELHKAPLQLGRIIEQVAQDREREADIKKVTVVLGLPGDLPSAYIDAIKLERAIGILVGNAIDLSPPGGKVTLSARADGNRVAIAVTADGASLSPEEVASLFDRRKKLRRGGEEINTVGLYVARQIATHHGGDIDVQVDPQHGTSLILSIPL
ncbi:MAG TPA: ATP-binding protein [Candidatus Binatia bacterium]